MRCFRLLEVKTDMENQGKASRQLRLEIKKEITLGQLSAETQEKRTLNCIIKVQDIGTVVAIKFKLIP